MEYKGFKLDFNALALLVSAVTAAVMAYKGRQNSKQNKEKDAAP